MLLGAVLVFPYLLGGSPALAFTNAVRIQVDKNRLWQCGVNWNYPYSPPRGRVWVMGRKVVEFDLRKQEDCDRVTTVTVEAPENFTIDVSIEVLPFGSHRSSRMTASLTTVAADRVWGVNFFNDTAWGEAISTQWPGQEKPRTVGYQLYFDGKLVSGSDAAGYTREQAEANCRWNIQTKPHLAIRCVYNGEVFMTHEGR